MFYFYLFSPSLSSFNNEEVLYNFISFIQLPYQVQIREEFRHASKLREKYQK